MKRKTLYITFIIVIIAGGGIYLYFKNSSSNKITWRTALVQKGDVSIDVTATGTLFAVTTVDVGTQVSGTISQLFADFNTQVKKGQTIALLDTTFLAAAADDAKANVQKAQIAADQSKREYDRESELFNQKVIAPAEYEVSLAAYETAKSNLVSAMAQLNRARINLRYATIKAPISGVVISRKVDVGQTVAASFNTPTLFTIANDLTKMQVQATIDEADIGQVKLNQDVFFTVDAYPNDSFAGKVTQIRLQPVTIQNVVNYIAIIEVPNPEMKLMPGMTANITVKVEEHKDVLKVPASALKFTPPNPDNPDSNRLVTAGKTRNSTKNSGRLWILENDSIFERPISTGLSDGSFTEVGGDITEGTVVITGMNTEEQATQQSQNPFMPKMPAPRNATRKK